MDGETFLKRLKDHRIPWNDLAQAIADIDGDDRVDALTEALEVLASQAMAEGTFRALAQLPPLVLPGGVRGDAAAFARLFFPHGIDDRPSSPHHTWQVDFWEWQRRIALSMEDRQQPGRSIARAEWLEKCRADAAWQAAVASLGEAYRAYIHFAGVTADRPSFPWERPRPPISAGRPECGHLEGVEPCRLCTEVLIAAREAHLGWSLKRNVRPQAAGSEQSQREISDCACCAQAHEMRMTGVTECESCAEFVFFAEGNALAGRWGGWQWLADELREDARDWARAQDPELAAAYEAAATRNSAAAAMVAAGRDEVGRLGTNPWRWASTFELPVGGLSRRSLTGDSAGARGR